MKVKGSGQFIPTRITGRQRKTMIGWMKMAGVVAALHFVAVPWAQANGGGTSKRVVIDKSQQVLRAYEGNRMVLQTHISSGRRGKETPSGHYRARSKSLMHYSRLYNNAPMPYSVQIAGNYFIHGFHSVPNYPASHGCIRVPISTARDFYYWVDHGTPVDIVSSSWRS